MVVPVIELLSAAAFLVVVSFLEYSAFSVVVDAVFSISELFMVDSTVVKFSLVGVLSLITFITCGGRGTGVVKFKHWPGLDLSTILEASE